ncbi:uncharacterized protein NEPG_02308 [Nematocida parisii ERTm1]|uniref:Uncharacterized protein n=1 Tax=Nematocida parisii (strain ERTm3) TaxID=935791 RepID=I3EEN2_NEMP3|nr:uncharacterized protein NEPG_02308 [Nematocida parisii ERTm1]EIJ87679.1 hypothetical protein NEQG_02226 [Nematocida parisii ERTm3]EIJ92909.1 hypothetical protein NEPG_02308 [Nematocida parisii ERTm1]|eukprot:XP_013060135.1 hypothetical protein NEPG_02308 [Nematocida parisii ERTm1]
MTYSRGVTLPPPCYVVKREKRAKGASSLLYLRSGLSLRGHGVKGRSCVRTGDEIKPLMLLWVSFLNYEKNSD